MAFKKLVPNDVSALYNQLQSSIEGTSIKESEDLELSESEKALIRNKKFEDGEIKTE